jgi:hypothetical protein
MKEILKMNNNDNINNTTPESIYDPNEIWGELTTSEKEKNTYQDKNKSAKQIKETISVPKKETISVPKKETISVPKKETTNLPFEETYPTIFNLKKNMIFKNYPELCQFLNIPILDGSMKRAQLDEIQRFCLLTKEKQSYVVKKTYDVPFPPTNKYGSSPYGKLTELILCELLLQHEKNSPNDPFVVSINELAKKIGFVNYMFGYYNKHPNQFSQNNNIPKLLVDELFHKIKRSYSGAIKTVLNKMENNQKLIICEEIVFVAKVDKNSVKYIKSSVKDKYGDETVKIDIVHTNKDLIFQQVSEFEKKQIIEVQQQTLKEIGCYNLQNVFMTGKQYFYYQTLQNNLVEHLGILFYYKAYNISFIKEYIYSNKVNLIQQIKQLNNTFLNNIVNFKFSFKDNPLSDLTDNSDILKNIETFCNKLVKYNYNSKQEYYNLSSSDNKKSVSDFNIDNNSEEHSLNNSEFFPQMELDGFEDENY